MPTKYGVRYPISGVHETPFGIRQARDIEFLAIREGIDAHVVVFDRVSQSWKEIS